MKLQVQYVHGVGTHADPADSPDPQEIGQRLGQSALAGDHHVLGGSCSNVAVPVARQTAGRGDGLRVLAQQMLSWLVDRDTRFRSVVRSTRS
jgi:hypothetical protein